MCCALSRIGFALLRVCVALLRVCRGLFRICFASFRIVNLRRGLGIKVCCGSGPFWREFFCGMVVVPVLIRPAFNFVMDNHNIPVRWRREWGMEGLALASGRSGSVLRQSYGRQNRAAIF
jgi:hypothetical protein